MDESPDSLQSTSHLATNSTTTPTEETEQDVNLNIPKMNYYFHHHAIQHSLFYWINNENTLNEMCNYIVTHCNCIAIDLEYHKYTFYGMNSFNHL